MTKSVSKPPTYRTAAQLRAAAELLVGTRPRSGNAAAGQAPPDEATGTVGELWLYGVVGGWWRGFDAESVSTALRGLDVDTLYVRIHSPGGNAADGVAIGNLLRNHRAKVVSVVDGLAASAASVIAVAGDEVVMCPGSQMMLHDVSLPTYGNAAQLRRDAEWCDGQSDNYAGVYAYKAGGTAAQWREVMLANESEGTWYTAEAAVSAGLADTVGTRPATSSPPTSPEDELDDELDGELNDDAFARIAHDLAILEQVVHPAARAAWQGRSPKPPTASAGGTTQPEGAAVVDFNDTQITALREQVGFPADADADTIVAAVTEALTESADPKETQVPAGHVVVPQAKLADLEAGAAAGVRAAQTLHDRDREAFLDANKTKYAAANRGAWATEYDRDPEGTRRHFAEAPVLVPINEIGHQDDGVDRDDAGAKVDDDPKYQSWRF